MNSLFTLRNSDTLLLVTLIHSCLYQAVNTEDCKAVADSSCRCRTDSGYEIDLTSLASE